MKKNDFIAIVTNNNGTINDDFTINISRDDFNTMEFDIDGLTVDNVSKNHKIIHVNNKTSYDVFIGKNKTVSGGNGVKSKNATYHVEYKKMDEKKSRVNDELSTRDELVTWLKSLILILLFFYRDYNSSIYKILYIYKIKIFYNF